MENLLLSLETEFFFLTGVYLEGVSGLILGVIIFCLILALIRYESKKEVPNINVDISNEIGDERKAKINLSRSLIEMDQKDEAQKLLNQLLEDNPSQEEKQTVLSLLNKINI
jgi:Tfp pilus assembly protein PilF